MDMEIPKFLQNNDEDTIHEEMFALIPDEYDKSEGQHLWNFTRPTANVVSMLRGLDIPEAIKLIWPKFSNGEYLDYHAETRRMARKSALNATGIITFTGEPGTVIPAGYTVSTVAKNDIPSQDYVTIEDCEIGEDGTVTVKAQASVAGSDGNTAAGTIVVNTSAYDDVTAVNNTVPFTGGVDEEDDESLIERISTFDSTQGDSNAGNPSDYKRWAESVPGTGTANVIRPKDTSGLVTIILTDGNNEPASEELCTSVYNYIMSPDDDLQRLAPCGASLQVIPPQTMAITISAAVELRSGTLENIKGILVDKVKEYFDYFIENNEILYQKIGNALGDIDGVYDFHSLLVNGGEENIPLDSGMFPIIDSSNITLTLAE